MSSNDLRELLAERIDAIPAPGGDLEQIRSTGRRIRSRRRAALGAGVLAVAAVVAGIALAGTDTSDDRDGREGRDGAGFASLGDLDFDHGVRAYSDGSSVYLGGRKFPAEDLAWLDTDAVATEHGIVFYDRGRPMLLDATGEVARLVDGPLDPSRGFRPTAKADASAPLVAWGTREGGAATITVRDMVSGADLATTRLDCGRCADVVIDGIDRGVVFVRDRDGTRTWDSATGEWAEFAGPDTRVADVRNGVVLYDGPAPTHPGPWRPVGGAVDSQLTLDGGHVLSWSSTLRPTTPDGRPIVLEQGPPDGRGAGWWTVDTDGSVLVVTGGDGYRVYDCLLPSGACEDLGALRPTGGDPMFIGNDM